MLIENPVVPQPPIATPDIANTNLNTPVSGNVLTNDRDPQGLPLTASLTSQPANGTVTLSPDGSYTYTPPTGFTGTTSFCYAVSNTAGLSSSACVTVNVLPVPDALKNNPPVANNDAVETLPGKPVVIAVLANDTDPDNGTGLNGQLANPTLPGQPTQGTAVGERRRYGNLHAAFGFHRRGELPVLGLRQGYTGAVCYSRGNGECVADPTGRHDAGTGGG